MAATANLDEYVAEMGDQLWRRCDSRRSGAPLCEPLDVDCEVEQQLKQLLDICRAVDSPLIDPYMDRLRDEICEDCEYQNQPVCPCPLKYLLPLAVSAVETVELRRRLLADRLAWPDDEMPETD